MIAHRFGAIAVALATALIFTCCSDDGEKPEPAPSKSAQPIRFAEIEGPAGIDFTNDLVVRGEFEISETIGTGIAVFDADGDDDLDLVCLNSGELDTGLPNQLFLRGADGRYEAVDGGPGLARANFSAGVALGDVDNDGDLDLFIANYGPDLLLLNDGKGRFEASDVSVSGIGDPGYATSAAFLDYDLDGWLDLFVCRYVVQKEGVRCSGVDGRDDYCHPAMYPAVSSLLYRNLGGGRFENVSEAMGIAAKKSYALGVVAMDFDDDGFIDIYVANDSRPNHLWLNQKGKGFHDEAMAFGLAVNGQGMPEASMGIAVGDVDGNGLIDLFLTHLKNESNTLYLRQAEGFTDGTSRLGLTMPSMPYTGFGTAFFDMDNDLDLDLAIVNGSVGREARAHPKAEKGSIWEFYVEPNQLYENVGGSFVTAEQAAGAFASRAELGRALICADLDVDGDVDMLVGNTNAPVRLLDNRGPTGNWIKIRAVDDELKRDALGALVTLKIGDRQVQRRIAYDGSFLCSSAAPAHFGLGDAGRVDAVMVVWPGGTREEFGALEAGKTHVLRRSKR